MKPSTGNYPEFLNTYLKQAPYNDVLTALRQTQQMVSDVFLAIPETKAQHRYADGKWTVNELIIHCSDTERIFAYRALRFARKDSQKPLPFDENTYAAESFGRLRSLKSCVDEFLNIRISTLHLFESFSEDVLLRKGNMASGQIDVNTLGFVIAGHATHHARILSERY